MYVGLRKAEKTRALWGTSWYRRMYDVFSRGVALTEVTVTDFNCTSFYVREGADKSLARPNSRCRRTESIVSLERGVYSCAELQVFSCY